MTKRVRVENADGSSFRLQVEVWQRGYPDGEPDRLIETRDLNHPADQADVYISVGRWLVVRELAPAVR